MSLLLKNVLVLDSNSPSHGKQANILIEKGIITSLNGKSASREIDLSGKSISNGWIDLNAQFHDPGNEHREDVFSGSQVGQRGGFTDICLMPDTNPPIEAKSDVKYLKAKSSKEVDLHVIAGISEGLKGENLTEVLDLQEAGAVAFSDGDKPIWNAELLLKALQYTSDIGLPVIQSARDMHISSNTHMHEGKMSTNLGLRGEPSLSEELIVHRDIEILKYSGGRIHFSRISTAGALELIKKAKKSGLQVTCDVGIHHLLFIDESIADFNPTFKSIPPYRTDKDRKALIKGVKDGTVDAICSNHRPFDQECKQLEFDLADPGNISLQTFYPSLLEISKQISFDILLHKVTNGPREILNMDLLKIDSGYPARLTVLDPREKWILNKESNFSKSENSPFWNENLLGKVLGTVNGTSVTFSS